MSIVPDNITQVINNLVPAAVRSDITSFIFYDNHPRDINNIDITICTKTREIKEFYQRVLISAIHLDTTSTPTQINILRTKNADLFYLVRAGNDLIILSRKEKLKLHKKIANVEKFVVEDATCKGYACLKVLCFNDAVPLLFDGNLEQLQDILIQQTSMSPDNSLPILTQLQRKLTEAKFSVKCNKKTYKEFLNIRHLASYSIYEKFNPNMNDSLCKSELKEITDIFKVEIHAPWVKTCNGKIVIAFDAVNRNTETLDDVQVLLHGTLQTSVVYTTKLFVKKDMSPFWIEEQSQKLKPSIRTAVTVVMDLKELKYNTLNRIEFSGFICYKKMGKKQLLPFDDVVVSSSDTMNEEFNVLSGRKIDEPKLILALLATTIKTDICLRHIKRADDLNISMIELFCTHLQMERVANMNNIIIHRISPYHTLYGIMIVFPENNTSEAVQCLTSMYSRSKSQVLALTHFIHDSVPGKIVMTTPTYKITAKINEFSHYNEEMPEVHETQLNYYDYTSSVLNRIDLVLQYLDNSIIKMNESKNSIVKDRIGKEIDICSGGIEKYLEFRGKMLDEGAKGIERLIVTDSLLEDESDAMIVD